MAQCGLASRERCSSGSRLRNRHKSPSKRLSHAIVKVACDPAAFVVLDLQYFCCKAAQARFCAVSLFDLAVEFAIDMRQLGGALLHAALQLVTGTAQS